MREWLKGKKTYGLSAIMLIAGISNILRKFFVDKEPISLEDFELVLAGAGLGTLRAGVTNESPKRSKFGGTRS